MKFIKVYLKESLVPNIAVIILSILSGLVAIKFTDEVRKTYNIETAIKYDGFFTIVFMLLIIFIIDFSLGVIGQHIHWKGMENIRVFFLSKVLKKDYKFFIENKPAQIWTDINMLSFQLTKFFKATFLLIGRLIQCVILTYLVFSISTYGGIIGVILIPIICLINISLDKKISELQTNMILEGRSLNTITLETMDSINNIKVKNKYDFFINRIIKKMKELNKFSIKNSLLITHWEALTNMITAIIPIIAIGIMTNKQGDIKLLTGDVISLYAVLPMMISSYTKVFSLMVEYSGVKPFIKKANDILDYKEETNDGVDISSFESLSFENVKIKYENGKVTSIPSMVINNKEKVLLLGESGIGKSTMMDILLGIKTDFLGIVKINGIDIKTINIKSLRKIIGISFQNNNVFNMSLEDNIKLGRTSSFDFKDIVTICDLDKQLKNKNNEIISNKTISGGEKSRISIAQNLYTNPSLILIDEALSSVNSEIEDNIMKSLYESFKDKTFICISHKSESVKYFDKIIKF